MAGPNTKPMVCKGQVFVKCGSSKGQANVKSGSSLGQARVKYGSSLGQVWVKQGSSLGQARVKSRVIKILAECTWNKESMESWPLLSSLKVAPAT